jgi:hypothetical protein
MKVPEISFLLFYYFIGKELESSSHCYIYGVRFPLFSSGIDQRFVSVLLLCTYFPSLSFVF